MNRPAITDNVLEYHLLPGYHVAAIHIRRHETFPAYEVYMVFEEHEVFEGRSMLVASGQTGKGDTFEEAVGNAASKLKLRLDEHRAELLEWAKRPKVAMKLKDTPVTTDLSDLNLDTLDLGDL